MYKEKNSKYKSEETLHMLHGACKPASGTVHVCIKSSSLSTYQLSMLYQYY